MIYIIRTKQAPFNSIFLILTCTAGSCVRQLFLQPAFLGCPSADDISFKGCSTPKKAENSNS